MSYQTDFGFMHIVGPKYPIIFLDETESKPDPTKEWFDVLGEQHQSKEDIDDSKQTGIDRLIEQGH